MKIMAALDLSGHAAGILEKAVEIAKQSGGELTIAVVAEDFLDIGDYLGESANITEKSLAAAKVGAAKYAAKAKELGVEAKVLLEQGVSPADLLVKMAEDNKIDLLVVGNRTKKGLDRFLIGSVASKVVAHAPCSVLVVR
ncbi:universal stress protein [Desulfovibrio sulfodismutans]|uniref:Universal stress protein n=1 Tax=Desulfolutivibrio sulfodismutans TaxID=63561 RepID=A0A7K3NR51_9BACT|nr:universal stress protein [Desulfolutivibrio sulfodismutans]NDY58587.1 universal stress protein [Desulfolutivibrio sulfodismutans]QLA12428.1 universal stress protein [Desulfolutivibrio sulfodismutans DSM 3696]